MKKCHPTLKTVVLFQMFRHWREECLHGANVSRSANRSCSSQASSSHFIIYIVIWFSSLGGTCSKSFLWTHFVGILILTLKRIGLAFTLEDVGIFSFQLYSSRVIVFISQHRLLSHTLNFLFLYHVRAVESVIGQSNDTVLSGCSIITCRMTSNAVPATSCDSRNIYIGFLRRKDTNITIWYSTQSYMAISWSMMAVLTLLIYWIKH